MRRALPSVQRETIDEIFALVDGAVVERGKPRMVQDVAVQVYRAGQTLLSLLAARSRQMDQTVATRYDRRRRHSWHDVNEYHSIPYFQYTSSIRPGPPKFVQCDIDNEQSTSQVQYLPFITEEMVEEQYVPRTERHTALESIHGQHLPSDRVQISITTKTEYALPLPPSPDDLHFCVDMRRERGPSPSIRDWMSSRITATS